jgi:hypothetical protein
MAQDTELINALTQRLQYGECVLFLGPDVLTTADGIPAANAFSAVLYNEIKSNNIEFDEQQKDNLYYTSGRYIKGINDAFKFQKETEHSLKRKYGQLLQQVKPNSIFEQLAALPFYLTINTNPDEGFYGLLKQQNGNGKCSFGYYDYTRKDNELLSGQQLPAEINSENRVVYNVYGHNHPERIRSLVTAESHFIEFSRAVNLPGNGMPNAIKNFISGGRICLFIGFRYGRWPLKLLLTALGFSKEVPEQNVSLLYDTESKHDFHFYRDELKFAFLSGGYREFTGQLYNSYRAMGTPASAATPEKPVHIVFISDITEADEDAKKDRKIRDNICKQLKPLEQNGYISQWTESIKLAGTDREQVLNEQYNNADIFVVIASGQLPATEYFSRIAKAKEAAAQHRNKKIIPVYGRHCLINQYPFEEKEWIPRSSGNQPEAVLVLNTDEDRKIMEVAKYIQDCAFTIQQQRN